MTDTKSSLLELFDALALNLNRTARKDEERLSRTRLLIASANAERLAVVDELAEARLANPNEQPDEIQRHFDAELSRFNEAKAILANETMKPDLEQRLAYSLASFDTLTRKLDEDTQALNQTFDETFRDKDFVLARAELGAKIDELYQSYPEVINGAQGKLSEYEKDILFSYLLLKTTSGKAGASQSLSFIDRWIARFVKFESQLPKYTHLKNVIDWHRSDLESHNAELAKLDAIWNEKRREHFSPVNSLIEEHSNMARDIQCIKDELSNWESACADARIYHEQVSLQTTPERDQALRAAIRLIGEADPRNVSSIMGEADTIKHRATIRALIELTAKLKSATSEAQSLDSSRQIPLHRKANLYTLRTALYENGTFKGDWDFNSSARDVVVAVATGDLKPEEAVELIRKAKIRRSPGAAPSRGMHSEQQNAPLRTWGRNGTDMTLANPEGEGEACGVAHHKTGGGYDAQVENRTGGGYT